MDLFLMLKVIKQLLVVNINMFREDLILKMRKISTLILLVMVMEQTILTPIPLIGMVTLGSQEMCMLALLLEPIKMMVVRNLPLKNM
jgi:hypothetical protein